MKSDLLVTALAGGMFLCAIAFLPAPAAAGTWVAHNDGLKNLTVIGIGIAPASPDVIYVQARSLGIYKSTDGGQSWTKHSTGMPDDGPGYGHLVHHGPVVHPTDPDIVWAVSKGCVYKTIDGGVSWSKSSTGTTVNGHDGVHGVVMDPNDPDHLFAGTIVSGADGGVFESTDGGANWDYIAGSAVPGSGVGNDAWPIALDSTDTNRLYCGSPHNSTYYSTDGGHTWTNSPPVAGDQASYEVAINPLAHNEIWANAAGGTWVSTDYAVSWTRRSDFNDEDIYAVQWAPSDPQVAYAIVGSTIWRSDDNGANWSARADVIGGPRCLAIHPTDPDVVSVGTGGSGMYKSTDGGQTFAEINNGLPLTNLIHGRQAFGDPLEAGGMYCILSGNVVYRRSAGETAWHYHSVSPHDYVQIDRNQPNRWYAASGGLWRSLDSGLTWEQVYTEGADTSVYGFWLDPRQGGRILVGDSNGLKVQLSDDGGDTWALLGVVPAVNTYLSDIAGDPFDPNNIVIAALPGAGRWRQHGYVWRSADGGQSWQHVRDQMFYDHWRIGDGYWLGWYGAMRQEELWFCNHHVNLDNQTFGNGTYECKIRILDSANGDMNKWAGLLIRTESPDSNYMDSGWLVYMRRNGVVAMHCQPDGTVINTEQTPVVGDTSNWVTIRLIATGNYFELYADDDLVGTYLDESHRYDGPGYFALQTCSTQAEFDNVNIQAETTFSDTFDLTQLYGACYGRWVAADPHNPGVFALTTQWGGVWRSVDHGATWQRISSDSDEGLLNYRPTFSHLHDGNLYLSRGSYYTWRIDNFHGDPPTVQKLGQTLTSGSINVMEDPFEANRLYGAVYGDGVLIYEGDDVAGPVTLVQSEPGTLVFQDGRQYPDGTVYAGTRDAHILQEHALYNAGGNDVLEACRYAGGESTQDRSIVVKFSELDTSLEAGKYLQQAILTLQYSGSRNDPSGVEKTLYVHKLLHDWGEGIKTGLDGAWAGPGEVCWTKPFGASGGENPNWNGTLDEQYADPVALDTVTLAGSEDYGPVSFDVTEAVRDHLSSPGENFGFVIREEQGSESNQDGTRQFCAREGGKTTHRPSLTLTFVPRPGDFDSDGDVDLDDYDTYFAPCYTGPGGQPSQGCEACDLDADNDVDLIDLATFQRSFTGG